MLLPNSGSFVNMDDPLAKNTNIRSNVIELTQDEIQSIYDHFRGVSNKKHKDMQVNNNNLKDAENIKPLLTKCLDPKVDPGKSACTNCPVLFKTSDWIARNQSIDTHMNVCYPDDAFSSSSQSQMNKRMVPDDIASSHVGKLSDSESMIQPQVAIASPNDTKASVLAEEVTKATEGTTGRPNFSNKEDRSMHGMQSSVAITAVASLLPTDNNQSLSATTTKKKRKRKPQPKIIPTVKVYVMPTEKDVLLGRGGHSNRHKGNKKYRIEVKNLQPWYTSTKDTTEKTDLSQCLVDYIHSYHGRFLDRDEIGWYEVPNIVARRKASQALREDDNAEKRAAKRSRFLQKQIAQKREQERIEKQKNILGQQENLGQEQEQEVNEEDQKVNAKEQEFVAV